MKNSVMTNVIQFYGVTTAGYSNPDRLSLYPCGSRIVGMVFKSDVRQGDCRIIQDGKVIFPVRSDNSDMDSMFNMSGYYSTGGGEIKLDNLSIPVNPNNPLTLEVASGGATCNFTVILIMGSENEISLLVDRLDKLVKLISEVKS